MFGATNTMSRFQQDPANAWVISSIHKFHVLLEVLEIRSKGVENFCLWNAHDWWIHMIDDCCRFTVMSLSVNVVGERNRSVLGRLGIILETQLSSALRLY
jgi:hypothetical protein